MSVMLGEQSMSGWEAFKMGCRATEYEDKITSTNWTETDRLYQTRNSDGEEKIYRFSIQSGSSDIIAKRKNCQEIATKDLPFAFKAGRFFGAIVDYFKGRLVVQRTLDRSEIEVKTTTVGAGALSQSGAPSPSASSQRGAPPPFPSTPTSDDDEEPYGSFQDVSGDADPAKDWAHFGRGFPSMVSPFPSSDDMRPRAGSAPVLMGTIGKDKIAGILEKCETNPDLVTPKDAALLKEQMELIMKFQGPSAPELRRYADVFRGEHYEKNYELLKPDIDMLAEIHSYSDVEVPVTIRTDAHTTTAHPHAEEAAPPIPEVRQFSADDVRETKRLVYEAVWSAYEGMEDVDLGKKLDDYFSKAFFANQFTALEEGKNAFEVPSEVAAYYDNTGLLSITVKGENEDSTLGQEPYEGKALATSKAIQAALGDSQEMTGNTREAIEVILTSALPVFDDIKLEAIAAKYRELSRSDSAELRVTPHRKMEISCKEGDITAKLSTQIMVEDTALGPQARPPVALVMSSTFVVNTETAEIKKADNANFGVKASNAKAKSAVVDHSDVHLKGSSLFPSIEDDEFDEWSEIPFSVPDAQQLSTASSPAPVVEEQPAEAVNSSTADSASNLASSIPPLSIASPIREDMVTVQGRQMTTRQGIDRAMASPNHPYNEGIVVDGQRAVVYSQAEATALLTDGYRRKQPASSDNIFGAGDLYEEPYVQDSAEKIIRFVSAATDDIVVQAMAAHLSSREAGYEIQRDTSKAIRRSVTFHTTNTGMSGSVKLEIPCVKVFQDGRQVSVIMGSNRNVVAEDISQPFEGRCEDPVILSEEPLGERPITIPHFQARMIIRELSQAKVSLPSEVTTAAAFAAELNAVQDRSKYEYDVIPRVIINGQASENMSKRAFQDSILREMNEPRVRAFFGGDATVAIANLASPYYDEAAMKAIEDAVNNDDDQNFKVDVSGSRMREARVSIDGGKAQLEIRRSVRLVEVGGGDHVMTVEMTRRGEVDPRDGSCTFFPVKFELPAVAADIPRTVSWDIPAKDSEIAKEDEKLIKEHYEMLLNVLNTTAQADLEGARPTQLSQEPATAEVLEAAFDTRIPFTVTTNGGNPRQNPSLPTARSNLAAARNSQRTWGDSARLFLTDPMRDRAVETVILRTSREAAQPYIDRAFNAYTEDYYAYHDPRYPIYNTTVDVTGNTMKFTQNITINIFEEVGTDLRPSGKLERLITIRREGEIDLATGEVKPEKVTYRNPVDDIRPPPSEEQ